MAAYCSRCDVEIPDDGLDSCDDCENVRGRHGSSPAGEVRS